MNLRAGSSINRSAPISSRVAARPPIIDITKMMSSNSRAATADDLKTVSIAPSAVPVTLHPIKKVPRMHGMSASRRFAMVVTTIRTNAAYIQCAAVNCIKGFCESVEDS